MGLCVQPSDTGGMSVRREWPLQRGSQEPEDGRGGPGVREGGGAGRHGGGGGGGGGSLSSHSLPPPSVDFFNFPCMKYSSAGLNNECGAVDECSRHPE